MVYQHGLFTGNGTACLMIKSGGHVYKFSHPEVDTVSHWVNLLEQYKTVDMFKNHRMLWLNTEESRVTELKQSVPQDHEPKSKIFGAKDWKSMDSVFSYTSTSSDVEVATYL